ncbi:MAG: dehydrogenase [Chloroflexi bacterium]|nr:dehydrogenase [Chloroflexota bacterium]
MSETFRVGLTRDFLKPDGTLSLGDIGLDLLDAAPGVERQFLPEDVPELRPSDLAGFDAILVLAPRVTAASLAGNERLAIVARFGVGYETIDVDACTERGIVLTITPDGVRRPVATSVLTLMLALTHKLLIKHELTRAGRWAEKLDHMGMGLTGRTLGVIGLGNIGRDVFKLAAPLEMRHLTFDPWVTPAQARAGGATLVDLDTLLRESDVVSVNCPLTPDTHHLLNRERLGLMKPTAYLINTARGPIVDQRALYDVLRERRIAGAALDVFDPEPPDPSDPLLQLDNVILAPHGICWTDECFHGNGSSACRSILDIAGGRTPTHVVNRAALDSPRFRAKLQRLASRAAGNE